MTSYRPCPSKPLLLRGIRPTPLQTNTKSPCGVCPTRCIYCDIWKLAVVVYSQVPLRSSPPLSPQLPHAAPRHHRDCRPLYARTPAAAASSFSAATAELERELDVSFATQRARLASIMSICTVEGASESAGLRLAHDRCLKSVEELIRRERVVRRENGVEGLRQRFVVDGEGRREGEQAMTGCGGRER